MYPYGNPNNNPNDYLAKYNPTGSRFKYVYKDSQPQKEEWQMYGNQPLTRPPEEWQSYGNSPMMPYYDRQQVPSDMMMYAAQQQHDQYKNAMIPSLGSLPKIPKFSGYEFQHDVTVDQQIELLKNQVFTLEQIVHQQQKVISIQQKHQQQLMDKLNSVLPPEPEKFHEKKTETLMKIDENLMQRSVAIRKSVENFRKENQPKLDNSIETMNRLCEIFENLCKVKVEKNEQKSPIKKQKSKSKSPQAPPEDRKWKQEMKKSPTISDPPKPDPIKTKKKPLKRLKENIEGNKDKNKKPSKEVLNPKDRRIKKEGDTPKKDSLLSLKKKIINQSKTKLIKREPNPKVSESKKIPERIRSDDPTALIAPLDYDHIYHTPISKQPKNIAHIPSDTPTTLIAPEDYQHLYSAKDKHARFVEKLDDGKNIEQPKRKK